MGETGCGKTYLVDFLCNLQNPSKHKKDKHCEAAEANDQDIIKNSFTLKVYQLKIFTDSELLCNLNLMTLTEIMSLIYTGNNTHIPSHAEKCFLKWKVI